MIRFMIDEDGDLIFRHTINDELRYELWVWEDNDISEYLLTINEMIRGTTLGRGPNELPKWVVVA